MFVPEDDDDDAPRSRHECVDCRGLAPETNTNYTLISAAFGWRLTRGTAPDGLPTMEWRCPACWDVHKRARGNLVTGETPAPGSRTAAKPPSDPVPASGMRSSPASARQAEIGARAASLAWPPFLRRRS
jgi:hypothetical protein